MVNSKNSAQYFYSHLPPLNFCFRYVKKLKKCVSHWMEWNRRSVCPQWIPRQYLHESHCVFRGECFQKVRRETESAGADSRVAGPTAQPACPYFLLRPRPHPSFSLASSLGAVFVARTCGLSTRIETCQLHAISLEFSCFLPLFFFFKKRLSRDYFLHALILKLTQSSCWDPCLSRLWIKKINLLRLESSVQALSFRVRLWLKYFSYSWTFLIVFLFLTSFLLLTPTS